MTIIGDANALLLWTFWIKCLIISSATSKSAITPSLNGLITSMFPGDLPNISFASIPTAITLWLPSVLCMATTEGSFNTIPCPLT